MAAQSHGCKAALPAYPLMSDQTRACSWSLNWPPIKALLCTFLAPQPARLLNALATRNLEVWQAGMPGQELQHDEYGF